jgi:hypothetical protein
MQLNAIGYMSKQMNAAGLVQTRPDPQGGRLHRRNGFNFRLNIKRNLRTP